MSPDSLWLQHGPMGSKTTAWADRPHVLEQRQELLPMLPSAAQFLPSARSCTKLTLWCPRFCAWPGDATDFFLWHLMVVSLSRAGHGSLPIEQAHRDEQNKNQNKVTPVTRTGSQILTKKLNINEMANFDMNLNDSGIGANWDTQFLRRSKAAGREGEIGCCHWLDQFSWWVGWCWYPHMGCVKQPKVGTCLFSLTMQNLVSLLMEPWRFNVAEKLFEYKILIHRLKATNQGTYRSQLRGWKRHCDDGAIY